MRGRPASAPAARPALAVALLLALAALLLAPGPAGAVGVLRPDWPSPPSDAPVDKWRAGRVPLTFEERLADRGWTDRDLLLETEQRLAATAALRERTAPRRDTGERSPLEPLILPDLAPLPVRMTDDLALSGRARVAAAQPLPSLLERPLGAPPEPWEIRSPSHLHEIMRIAPPELAEASRLGLTDLLRTGMTVHVAPGEAQPNWAEDIWAESDPLTRGLSLAQSGPRPRQPQSAEFVGMVVLGALVFGALALTGIVYAIIRESDGPKKLRSRRFG
jgi:hypothetical protein